MKLAAASPPLRTGVALRPELHAWLPWIFSASLGVTGEFACHHLRLLPDQLALVRGGILSTVILLLVTRQHWSHDRLCFEGVGLAALAPAAWLAGHSLPAAGQALGVFGVCCALPGYTAWRFEPDFGQTGVLWTLRTSVRHGIPAFLGLLLPLVVLLG
jgi:hypothetical protein